MLHCEVVSARSQPASNLKIEEHTRGSTPMGILVQKKRLETSIKSAPHSLHGRWLPVRGSEGSLL